ncbi:MAG: hypothetical protein R2818_05800 [Flavobacteriales bacterium]
MYLLFALSSVVYFHGGWPFLKGAMKELRSASPGHDDADRRGHHRGLCLQFTVVFGLEGKLFLLELVTSIDIMLLGHWIEMRSVLGASKALQMLVSLMPAEAHVMRTGAVRDVPWPN